MKRINIMTSCDDRLSKMILPQLASIDKNLSGYEVHFYLVHTRIEPDNVKLLKDFVKAKTGIIFHEIVVAENLDFYESLVEKGGGQWPHEAYITLRIQDYIPDDVDRIMYIDSGDVIIDGDIGPYYFGDFEGNSIIATPVSLKTNSVTGEKTLYSRDDILDIAMKGSLFNSGSYVINVDKFRSEGYTIEDYLYLADALIKNNTKYNAAYFGDQGFLAAAFVEDVKFYGYPEYKDPSFMPYNFRSLFWPLYKKELTYTPIVVHYAIIAKPWVVRFSEKEIMTIIDQPGFIGRKMTVPIPTIGYMTPEHLRLGEIWWSYAKETPIYEETDIRARITADSWVKYYFPLCENYQIAYENILKLKAMVEQGQT